MLAADRVANTEFPLCILPYRPNCFIPYCVIRISNSASQMEVLIGGFDANVRWPDVQVQDLTAPSTGNS